MSVETEVEIESARKAGGDWAELYQCHIRAVKQPLSFKEYKQLRHDWERVMFSDPGDSIAKRKQLELETALGL